MSILEDMAEVRRLDSLFQRLRHELAIPLRQPLLDWAYYSPHWLPKDMKAILAEGLNIYDIGTGVMDTDHYHGFDTVRPEGNHWRFADDGRGTWVALSVAMPDWLKEIGDKRAAERDAILERKKAERNA